MNPGEFRHRAALRSRAAIRDSFGGESIVFNDVAEVWCKIEPLSGRELFAAQQARAEVTTRVTMRYRAGVLPEWRIAWGGLEFNIVEVIDLEARREYLQLMCSGPVPT
jgi:SPP1 family predicted phage head-tail adaptor